MLFHLRVFFRPQHSSLCPADTPHSQFCSCRLRAPWRYARSSARRRALVTARFPPPGSAACTAPRLSQRPPLHRPARLPVPPPPSAPVRRGRRRRTAGGALFFPANILSDCMFAEDCTHAACRRDAHGQRTDPVCTVHLLRLVFARCPRRCVRPVNVYRHPSTQPVGGAGGGFNTLSIMHV